MSRTPQSRATVALSAAVALLGTSFLSTGIAFADDLKNQTVVAGYDVVSVGGSTTLTYQLQQENASKEGAGGLNGCNASTSSPVVIAVSVPTGVTADKSALTFYGCQGNDTVQVTYTGVTAGAYPIRHAESSGLGINTGSTADFTLTVDPATTTPPPLEPPADATAPVLSLPADITAEATSASGAVVIYTATADDAVDGSVDISCVPASGSNFPLDVTTVNCSATDAAGNEATGSFAVTVEDTTAPELGTHADVTAEATSAAGAVVTYTAPTATDVVDENPVATCLPASGSTFPITDTTVSCTAKDAAGNTSAASGFTVKVQDTTAPSDITFSDTGIQDGDSYLPSAVPANPNCTATDAVTAEPTCVVTGRSVGFGAQTLTATATDTAGNSSTATISYTVRSLTLSGFRAPVDLHGVLNTVKGGSTVPLKFTVMDGATPVTSTAGLTFSMVKVACATGVAGEDVIEELASTGGTALRYDTTGQQFIQNWKTPTTAGVCYKVSVSSGDAQTPTTALFKIK